MGWFIKTFNMACCLRLQYSLLNWIGGFLHKASERFNPRFITLLRKYLGNILWKSLILAWFIIILSLRKVLLTLDHRIIVSYTRQIWAFLALLALIYIPIAGLTFFEGMYQKPLLGDQKFSGAKSAWASLREKVPGKLCLSIWFSSLPTQSNSESSNITDTYPYRYRRDLLSRESKPAQQR